MTARKESIVEAAKLYADLAREKKNKCFSEPEKWGPLPPIIEEDGYMFIKGAEWADQHAVNEPRAYYDERCRLQATINNLEVQLSASEQREARLVEALEKVDRHGCCLMHNDTGCPGCTARFALVEHKAAKEQKS